MQEDSRSSLTGHGSTVRGGLAHLGARWADLSLVLERSAVQREALRLLTDHPDLELAWFAEPTEDDGLVLNHVLGAQTPWLHGLEVRRGSGLTGKVYDDGRPWWVDDYTGASSITHEFDRYITQESLRGLVAVPVLRGARSWGVLAAGTRRGTSIEGRTVDLVRAVAEQAALATAVAERARLQQEVAVLQERQRMAREMHDSVGALLYAIGAGAKTLASTSAVVAPEVRHHLEQMVRQAETATVALRESLRNLRASPGELALGVAFRADASAFEQRSGTRAEVVLLDELPEVAPAVVEVMTRAVREALLNVDKHARASSVVVTVSRWGSGLAVSVIDDGVGLTAATADSSPGTGMGLDATRNALARLGGSLHVGADSFGGTSWTARVP